MELRFTPRKLEINNARIMFRNFKGEETQYNHKGDRNFVLIIAGGMLDDGRTVRDVSREEMADALRSDTNRFGVGWNVKISHPKEEG